ncbi:MAG: hypothetical protein N4A41_00560 [Crocinitomicaceae bacterium]|jgi:hypothetical protein|nr:hypothetical protein [Crocinitomicaceae bacterium]
MKLLETNITVGRLAFDFVNQATAETGWEQLSDSATLVFPSNLNLDKNKLKSILKVGDRVIIEMGYLDGAQIVFEGYLTEIKPTTPIELKCTDEMWRIKQKPVNINFRGGSVKSLLQELLPEYEIDAFDIQIGGFRATNMGMGGLLEKLRSAFGLYTFMRNGKVTVNKQYNREEAIKHKFQIDFNMASEDLEYKTLEDLKLKIKAISNNSDGSKTEIEIGDPEGALQTLNFYNLDKVALKAHAEKEFERLKYEGWRGSFTAFGEPIVRHGDLVELFHAEESDKTGTYWVDQVSYETGINGCRQKIQLGPAA